MRELVYILCSLKVYGNLVSGYNGNISTVKPGPTNLVPGYDGSVSTESDPLNVTNYNESISVESDPINIAYYNGSISTVESNRIDFAGYKGSVSTVSGPRQYFDWRQNGGVSPVKDQQSCAACWAFSAVANIESQYWIRGYRDVILSEQFLIDCNGMGVGCSNAGIIKAFCDILSNFGGVLQNADYPPYVEQKRPCRWNNNSSLMVPVIGLNRVQPFNEDQMAEALVKHGPLSAAINDAMMAVPNRDPLSIDMPTEQQCPTDKSSLNHAVLIVGFNVFIDPNGRSIPYWIIKNSWGETWGDHGYYYLQRGINACGIASDVSYATIPEF